MQLRKLDKEYQQCLDADISQKLENYDIEATPNLDALKAEFETMKLEQAKQVDNEEEYNIVA